MADTLYISKVSLPNGNQYDIKDAKAREDIAALEAYTDYLGVTTTALTDGASTNPVTINGESVTAKKGNIVNYGSAEFIFNGSVWQEFGDLSGLGALAFEDTADVTGTAAAQTFTGTEATIESTGTFTAEGTVTLSGGTAQTVVTDVTPSDATVKVLDTAGSTTAGSAAAFTQGTDTFTQGTDTFTQGTDTFTATVTNEVLSLDFTQGTDSFTQGSDTFAQGTDSFTANTPTAVTLPTFKDQTVITDVTSSGGSVTVPDTATFEGTANQAVSVSATYTPAGTNGTSAVTGTAAPTA